MRNTFGDDLLLFFAMGLLVWIGGNKVIASQISIGTLAKFLTFMTILQMPVRQIGLLVNAFPPAPNLRVAPVRSF